MNPIKTYNHGTGPVDLRHLNQASIQCTPIEMHLKTDGSLTDKPSFTIVMILPLINQPVHGQYTLETFQKCLDELGYEITEKK